MSRRESLTEYARAGYDGNVQHTNRSNDMSAYQGPGAPHNAKRCTCGICQAERDAIKYPLDPPGYAMRVREMERQGLTTSDAQGVADYDFAKRETSK